MAIGFEDDSFAVFSLRTNFQVLARGVGHKSFVSQIRFDNYLQEFIDKYTKDETIKIN